ncbi:pentapeptide repeat-containing protein [Nodosilinea sp. LEGE 07088]|uniref:pentapeptide repeat-containing protein n=1 Tax=Nodosilinea sp. LEGE 07088 TaxID=2777968 RepID=UPI0018827BAE|nr:pentapeptide repeat-containing protein [Nodosilinea sp. LEGE 07088]MBE9139206.1 pentapeptide repeat-containing protein [Nodosilinea sp. LEGE 07088]
MSPAVPAILPNQTSRPLLTVVSPTMRPAHTSFINQDLRRHSFRQQALQNGHFSDCDLRGCNFYQADLRGARFIRCRTGSSLRKIAIAGLPSAIGVAFMAHAVSSLVFGALGTLPGQAAWPYVVALYISLAIAAISAALTTLSLPSPRLPQALAGLSTAALMGFFYGGRLTDNNPTVAITGAVGLGLLGCLVAGRVQMPLVNAIVTLLGAIAAYGLAFLLWVSGSNLFTTGTWGRGVVIGIVAVLCVVVTVKSLIYGWRSLRHQAATSFRQADLRACTFQATDIAPCDLTQAIRDC